MYKQKTYPALLITTAVNASANRTQMTHTGDRLNTCLQALKYWLDSDFTDIVICDGSGFDFSENIKAINLTDRKINIEILHFINNNAAVKIKGKGFGEGEIVDYALRNSEILRAHDSFAKCTGKLWVDNYRSIINNFNMTASFDFNGLFPIKQIDTRFYITSKVFYEKHLVNTHNAVDENSTYYLEHAFKDSLSSIKLASYLMLPIPKIQGWSGSQNICYTDKPLKRFLRNIRSLLIRTFQRQSNLL